MNQILVRVLLIDCEDSFTLNIANLFRKYAIQVDVISHDKLDINSILKYNGIILSPGPKEPNDIPILDSIIEQFKSSIPILGICLGHQAIGIHFKHQLIKSSFPMHGLSPKVTILHNHDIFKTIDRDSLTAMRYNSLTIAPSSNSELSISCIDENGEIMGFTHPSLPIIGFQFHPESIGTFQGEILLKNWINFLFSFWDKTPK